ncbi:MAG TPA: hypothetical protein VD846_02595 [Allosphingosinicella sp.]|nr:hypothetical protein [Allosphingosinicella sp.]
MRDIMTDALAILIACLVIAAIATAVVIFRPSARRRRRHKRHSRRPRIDLFEPAGGAAAEPDA